MTLAVEKRKAASMGGKAMHAVLYKSKQIGPDLAAIGNTGRE